MGTLGYDRVIISGDFNAWHPAWGAQEVNKRGSELHQGLTETGFNISYVPSITRAGNDSQKDINVDFFCASGDFLSDSFVGPQISDHHIISVRVDLGFSVNTRNLQYDYRRTYDANHSQLLDYFEGIDWRSLFISHTFDAIPGMFNDLILPGWRLHGVTKWVNQRSRPWYSVSKKLKQ